MKDETEPRETYHHGNLPQTLIDKAAELLAEKGAEGFSMREVARRAGVAVAAPSHHFGNAKGLLTAIATCAFQKLTEEQSKAMTATDDPVDRIIALARTYIRMSVGYPGYAAVIFRWDLVDHEDAAYAAAATASFDLLMSAVADALPKETGQTDIRHTAKTIWAAMHGFVTLSMTEGDEADQRIEFAVRTLLAGVNRLAV